MGRARVAVAAIAAGMALAVVPTDPAWACSCIAVDPGTQITMKITDSGVADVDNPFGGDGAFGATVDLRGAETTVVGDVPVLLEGLDLESVPVLAAVVDDPNMSDSCGTPPRPELGSQLEVTGTVLDEGGARFIYAGPCSGSFTVLAGPVPGVPGQDRGGGRGLLVPIALGAAGVLVLGLIAGGVLWQPRRAGS